jgi:hypothetical protein
MAPAASRTIALRKSLVRRCQRAEGGGVQCRRRREPDALDQAAADEFDECGRDRAVGKRSEGERLQAAQARQTPLPVSLDVVEHG